MLQQFSIAAADLSDPTPREWLVFVVAPSLTSKLPAGTVVEALLAESVDEKRLGANSGFTIERRTATNAELAAWFDAKAAAAQAADTANVRKARQAGRLR